MSILNPKFRVSTIEGVDFKQEPYDTSKKFAIFIPKEKDIISEILEKHDDNVRAKVERHKQIQMDRQKEKDKVALAKQRSMNLGGSPTSSPKRSPDNSPTRDFHSVRAHNNKIMELEEVANFSSPQSKLRSKLTCDVELARTYDTDDFNKRSLKFDETNTKSVNFEGTGKHTLLGESMNDRMMQSDVQSVKSQARSTKSNASRTSKKSFHSTTSRFSKLKNTLYYDTRTMSVPKSALKNKVIDDIIDNEDIVMKNQTLYNSLLKLRDMNLLKQSEPHFNHYKGVGKINYVYNDFHARNTNPGYSRNTGGAFYYR
jgi:hypothetical protein